MNFLCQCDVCGVLEWLSGMDDPDTNSCEITGDLSCGHARLTVIDVEYESLVGDEVI